MRTLYHGTSSLNLDSIKRLGLIPGHAKGGDAWAAQHHWPLASEAKHRIPTVCLAVGHAEAADFARLSVEEMGGSPVVIKLHIPEAVFQTYTVDDLFSSDMEHPKAWRAPKVDPSYIVEALPVKAGPSVFTLGEELKSLLGFMQAA